MEKVIQPKTYCLMQLEMEHLCPVHGIQKISECIINDVIFSRIIMLLLSTNLMDSIHVPVECSQKHKDPQLKGKG